ncbi:MAG: hypothetical protein ACRDOK_18785 [Streptosporangiaceae bacterium]
MSLSREPRAKIAMTAADPTTVLGSRRHVLLLLIAATTGAYRCRACLVVAARHPRASPGITHAG